MVNHKNHIKISGSDNYVGNQLHESHQVGKGFALLRSCILETFRGCNKPRFTNNICYILLINQLYK